MYPCSLKHGDENTNVSYLRGETDLERERIGLHIGERVRLRGIGDLLRGAASSSRGTVKEISIERKKEKV